MTRRFITAYLQFERDKLNSTDIQKQMNIFDRLVSNKLYHTLTLMKVNEARDYECTIFLQEIHISI